MSNAGWICDSCEADNVVHARVCRLCGRPPGNVAGSDAPVDTMPLPLQAEWVTVTDSRYGQAEQWPGPSAEPVPFALLPAGGAEPPSPRPKPRPATSPNSGYRIALVLLGVVAAALAGLVVVLLVNAADESRAATATSTPPSIVFETGTSDDPGSGSGPGSPPESGSTPSGSTPAGPTSGGSTPDGPNSSPAAPEPAGPDGPPCPDEVTTWLPDNGSGAELVAGYVTDEFVLTICRDARGRLFYDGQRMNAAPSSESHILLPAVETPTGYIATNESYSYEITETELIIRVDDAVVARAAVTQTGPW